MNLIIEKDTTEDMEFDLEEAASFIIERALDVLACPYETEVTLTIVDNERIRELNREYRDIDRETDVLSFPLIDFDEPGVFPCDLEERAEDYFDLDTGELMLGDIVVSAEKVKQQASEYGHSVLREYSFLITHSILHLFGYDHMEEKEREKMEELQRRILDEAGIKR